MNRANPSVIKIKNRMTDLKKKKKKVDVNPSAKFKIFINNLPKI